MGRGILVAWYSLGGWLMGHSVGTTKGVEVRVAQFRLAADPAAARRIAAGLVEAKIRNQCTMLRRNWKGEETPEREETLERMKRLAEAAPRARDASHLLGLEGEAAALYFALFPRLIAEGKADSAAFSFDKRSRRPPEDPVNALLSFTYGLATRLFLAALTTAGFDPYLGFLHRPRHGRPALALDMMEPFRPILCDSTVLMAINNGEIGEGDFIRSGPAVALKPQGRKALIAGWERRLDQETAHPLFGYRITMRRLVAVQCRLLARHVMGEIADMPHYVPR